MENLEFVEATRLFRTILAIRREEMIYSKKQWFLNSFCMKQQIAKNSTDILMRGTTERQVGTNTTDLDLFMIVNGNAAAKKDNTLKEKEETIPTNLNMETIVNGIEIVKKAKLIKAVILAKPMCIWTILSFTNILIISVFWQQYLQHQTILR